MVEFVASNGFKVKRLESGIVQLFRPDGSNDLNAFSTIGTKGGVALSEFFLHEAGIWLDPVTGAHVYRSPERDDEDGRCILSVSRKGDPNYGWEWRRNGLPAGLTERYFSANPAPAPWRNAKNGEIWVFKDADDTEPNAFTFDGYTKRWLNSSGNLLGESYTRDRPYGDGHDKTFVPYRIWPVA